MADNAPQRAPASERRLRRIEALSHLLDDSIRLPILGYRVGWEAVIGLVPGLGDVAGLLLSAYLVFEASRFGLPKARMARMAFNVAVEALVGAVPVLGDVFDATWKANLRNLDLLHAHLGTERARRRPTDRRFPLGVLALLLLLVLAMGAVLFLVLAAVVRLLGG